VTKSTTIIAFDQHAATTVAAVLLPGHRTPALHSLTSDVATIQRFVKRLQRQGTVTCCYEAGPCGFELQRALTAQHMPCEVIAPALIPRRAGDQSKTDRRDAGQLAVLYRAGAFTATKKAWSKRHDGWLRAQTWSRPALEQTHRAYLRAVDETLARRRDVEADLQALLDLEPLQTRVQRLRCFRGIDGLTALTIAAELGDPRRFATAPRTMAFVGLVPSEHSSGSKRAQGGVTKTGNAHLRRVLVESA
jgi:transposase